MPDGGVGPCCRCFCGFTTATCSILFFLALFLPSSKPTCSIDRIYIPALNKSLNSTTNHTLFFHLKLLNKNTLKGIDYDPINLTFYYDPIPTVALANHTVPGFYQRRKRSTRLREALEARGAPWEAALRAASNGSAVTFRVDLATAVRDKFLFRKSKRKKLVVGGTVKVNAAGENVAREAVKLKSGTPGHESHCAWVGISVVFTVLVFVFL